MWKPKKSKFFNCAQLCISMEYRTLWLLYLYSVLRITVLLPISFIYSHYRLLLSCVSLISRTMSHNFVFNNLSFETWNTYFLLRKKIRQSHLKLKLSSVQSKKALALFIKWPKVDKPLAGHTTLTCGRCRPRQTRPPRPRGSPWRTRSGWPAWCSAWRPGSRRTSCRTAPPPRWRRR